MADVNQPKRPSSTPSEGAGSTLPPKGKLEAIAVPTAVGLPAQIDNKRKAILAAASDLSLADAEKLMLNCKLGQVNLTEALNEYAAYRKAVSDVLQRRRQEAAQARKAANSARATEAGAPIATDFLLETSLDSGSPIGEQEAE